MRSAMASMTRSHSASSGKVFLVVGGVDVLQLVLAGERGWLEFLQTIQGLPDDAVLVAFLGRQIEQHDRHIGIGQVSGDLRPHDSRAQDRGLRTMNLFIGSPEISHQNDYATAKLREKVCR